jgi:hypothetical protein
MTEDTPQPEVTAPESGFIYRTVTQYWPRIAGGIVLLGAGLGWFLDAMTVEKGFAL